LDCAEEIASLKRELAPLVGGEDRLAFDLLHAKLTVRPASSLAEETVVEAVRRAGLRAEPWREGEPDAARAGSWERHGRALGAAASGILLVAAFTVHVLLAGGIEAALGAEGAGEAHDVPAIARGLYALGTLAGFWLVLPRAWLAVRRLRPDMNLLMAVAVLGAIAIGEWFEAHTVAFLFAVSLALEAWSVGRARRAIGALLDLAPRQAHWLRDGVRTVDVSPEEVPVGARIQVRPGERIPLDGCVISGESAVDESLVTGESLPVDKGQSAAVFAGTINGDGTLTVEVTKEAGQTTLARIARLVGEAHARRAPSEQWVDRFARVYTPVVMVLALGVALGPPLLFGAPMSGWLYKGLVLLVIACPCALVISTPVSIVAGLTAAARHGVLIKGGIHLEAAGRLQALAIDKTGTLTEGRARVFAVVGLGGHSEEEVLARAAAMEVHSDHPLARAIVNEAHRRRIAISPAESFEILKGKGAHARLAGRDYWLGSHRYLEERGQERGEVHRQAEALSADGCSVVVIGNDRHACGMVAIADEVRREARESLDELARLGVGHVEMLTGDNAATAQAIAHRLGLANVKPELLPEDKVTAVEDLTRRYSIVAMVGDGVNDAPAMARASFGVAMGAAGSDVAIETADIALLSEDLRRLPWLVAHGRRTLRVIRQNIAVALAVKALFLVLTVAGAASLWSAIAADMGASLLVIFNGLRLARVRRSG
jgi:Cd2+/Zn2+-exporting ATPase